MGLFSTNSKGKAKEADGSTPPERNNTGFSSRFASPTQNGNPMGTTLFRDHSGGNQAASASSTSQVKENSSGPRLPTGPSRASKILPHNAQKLLNSGKDQAMASRQTSINTLSKADREKQDSWARTQLKKYLMVCREDFEYVRMPGGYRCEGGGHAVSDELLAEGRGGFYRTNEARNGWLGPYYSEVEAYGTDEAKAEAGLGGPGPGPTSGRLKVYPGERRSRN